MAELQEQIYRNIAIQLGLTDDMSMSYRSGKIVSEAALRMQEYNEAMHAAYVASFDKLCELCPELSKRLNKATWRDMIIATRIGKVDITENKALQKLLFRHTKAKHIAIARANAVLAIVRGDSSIDVTPTEIALPTEQQNIGEEVPVNLAITELLEQSASIAEDAEQFFLAKIALLRDAFRWLTGESPATFNRLVKTWQDFDREDALPASMTKLMQSLATIAELAKFGNTAGVNWLARLGLKIDESAKPSPTRESFGKLANAFADLIMFKLIDGSATSERLSVKPWHHVISDGETCFAYVWDTRVIELSFSLAEVNMSDIDEDYIDNCQALRCEDAELLANANLAIPSVLAQQAPQYQQTSPALPTEVAEAKRHQLFDGLSEQGKAAVSQDPTWLYMELHSQPSIDFDPNYNVKWSPGMLCEHRHLGLGQVVGLTEDKSAMNVYFASCKAVLPCWPWHLTPVSTEASPSTIV